MIVLVTFLNYLIIFTLFMLNSFQENNVLNFYGYHAIFSNIFIKFYDSLCEFLNKFPGTSLYIHIYLKCVCTYKYNFQMNIYIYIKSWCYVFI